MLGTLSQSYEEKDRRRNAAVVQTHRYAGFQCIAPSAILSAVDGADTATEVLEGTLEQILYVNDVSGYVVALVEPIEATPPQPGPRVRVTVVGTLGAVEIGAGLRLSGRFEKHPRWG